MPSLNGTVVSFYLEGGRKHGKDFERDESRKGMRKDGTMGLTKLVYKLKLNY